MKRLASLVAAIALVAALVFAAFALRAMVMHG